MNFDFSRFLVCILVLAKIVFVQIIVPGGIGLGLAELEIIEGRAAARQVDEYLMGYTNLE